MGYIVARCNIMVERTTNAFLLRYVHSEHLNNLYDTAIDIQNNAVRNSIYNTHGSTYQYTKLPSLLWGE